MAVNNTGKQKHHQSQLAPEQANFALGVAMTLSRSKRAEGRGNIWRKTLTGGERSAAHTGENVKQLKCNERMKTEEKNP